MPSDEMDVEIELSVARNPGNTTIYANIWPELGCPVERDVSVTVVTNGRTKFVLFKNKGRPKGRNYVVSPGTQCLFLMKARRLRIILQ